MEANPNPGKGWAFEFRLVKKREDTERTLSNPGKITILLYSETTAKGGLNAGVFGGPIRRIQVGKLNLPFNPLQHQSVYAYRMQG